MESLRKKIRVVHAENLLNEIFKESFKKKREKGRRKERRKQEIGVRRRKGRA